MNAFARSFYPKETGGFSNTMNMSLLGEGLIVLRAAKFLFPEHTYFFNQACVVSVFMIYASSHVLL